jgi:arginine utilization protein RocB
MLPKPFVKKIEKLTIELTNIESVVGTPGELHVQEKIHKEVIALMKDFFTSKEFYLKDTGKVSASEVGQG